jgi:hypothetical protein
MQTYKCIVPLWFWEPYLKLQLASSIQEPCVAFWTKTKHNKIIIHAGQGSKIHLYSSNVVIPHKLWEEIKPQSSKLTQVVMGWLIFRRYQVWILTVAHTILTEDFHGFPQSFQAMIEISHDHFSQILSSSVTSLYRKYTSLCVIFVQMGHDPH